MDLKGNLDLDEAIDGSTLLIRPRGEIDLSVADALRLKLDNLIEDYSVKNLIINLSGISFIDSSGLGVMLGRYKKLSSHGGRVLLVSPAPQVRRILELSGILNIMQECSGEAEAFAKAQGGYKCS